MMTLTLLLVVALSLLTWFFPFLACCFAFARRRNSSSLLLNSLIEGELKSLAILIPVGGEARLLETTLSSIKAAESAFRNIHSQCSVSIHVGLDGQSRQAEAVAKEYGATVLSSSVRVGKWGMLKSLVAESDAEWVAFVDVGAIWPGDLLLSLFSGEHHKRVACIAPGYRPKSGSLLTGIIWKIEQCLKRLENLSGGPIAVHGATVFYNRDRIQSVFNLSIDRSWWNDDVVIPYFLRMQDAASKIAYISDVSIFDCEETVTCPSWSDYLSEFRRRQRMALGNLQWLVFAFKAVRGTSPVLLCLIMRRAVRVLWAYCGALAILVLAGLIGGVGLLLLCVLTSVLVYFVVLKEPRYLQQLSSIIFAAINSLCVPVYLLRLGRMQVVWR